MMKRFIKFFLCICLIFSVTACGNSQNVQSSSISKSGTAASTEILQQNSITASTEILQQNSIIESTEVLQQNSNIESTEILQQENNNGINTEAVLPIEDVDDNGNILIAYFTWAENTVVADPNAVDADATTSASVLLPGNAAKLANWIQERTGGDLFSIVVKEPYSSNYDECLDRAADEKAKNTRPELVNHVENMENYDTIFLGFPNWWYTVPMAIHSFLEEYDFSGKTVIPFVTHGTGGLASTINDITDALPESATILETVGIFRSEVDSSHHTINEWLDGLGFTEKIASRNTKQNIMNVSFELEKFAHL